MYTHWRCSDDSFLARLARASAIIRREIFFLPLSTIKGIQGWLAADSVDRRHSGFLTFPDTSGLSPLIQDWEKSFFPEWKALMQCTTSLISESAPKQLHDELHRWCKQQNLSRAVELTRLVHGAVEPLSDDAKGWLTECVARLPSADELSR